MCLGKLTQSIVAPLNFDLSDVDLIKDVRRNEAKCVIDCVGVVRLRHGGVVVTWG